MRNLFEENHAGIGGAIIGIVILAIIFLLGQWLFPELLILLFGVFISIFVLYLFVSLTEGRTRIYGAVSSVIALIIIFALFVFL